jgi:hypothetical protein
MASKGGSIRSEFSRTRGECIVSGTHWLFSFFAFVQPPQSPPGARPLSSHFLLENSSNLRCMTEASNQPGILADGARLISPGGYVRPPFINVHSHASPGKVLNWNVQVRLPSAQGCRLGSYAQLQDNTIQKRSIEAKTARRGRVQFQSAGAGQDIHSAKAQSIIVLLNLNLKWILVALTDPNFSAVPLAGPTAYPIWRLGIGQQQFSVGLCRSRSRSNPSRHLS